MTTESLGNRVKRLLTANVHALVSSLEARAPQAVRRSTCASSTR
ncbi:hypothetical protein RA280_09185 [Cupriavidus sp. CV2]|nr:hypothetical protein [Cupriavidus sp. CV2]MDW3681920.1 hypothetical protein [Cupriavidus sp. CV2]